ncbi:MAG: class I SAM-dependent RNA methyltransferase [Planctomycetota bacterium]|nr:MAG: class I SAM-dependent RNA methyltransferase [Planctomycetota bacterium]
MDLERPRRIRLTCARELAPALCAELDALGYAPSRVPASTAVELEGTLADCMRLNLHLRTAFSVQLRLAAFPCPNPDALYAAVRELEWESLVPRRGYLSVVSRASTPSVDNSMYPSLRVKDAVCDRLRERWGERPNAGPRRDRTVLFLLWQGQRAELYLDTSGRKLSDRGYRQQSVAAPMRETLAAAVLAAAGYVGERPLVNPMCGSGTLAIEAALLATRRAPGLLRSNYGFQHVQGFDAEAWRALRAEARRAIRPAPAPIVATDHDARALAAARANARTAGVERWIRFERCDFAESPVPSGPGVVVLNPPYGKRLGAQEELGALYGRIGDFLKQRCAGYTGHVFTADLALAKRVGLRSMRRTAFHNGELECRLLSYELYAGSRKRRASAGEEAPSPEEP